jgi:hypothetical protein
LFAHAPLLFFIQAPGKGDQLLEELLGVEAEVGNIEGEGAVPIFLRGIVVLDQK